MSLEEARARLRARVRGRPVAVAPRSEARRTAATATAFPPPAAAEAPLEADLSERLAELLELAPEHADSFRRLDVHQQRAVLRPDRALAVRAQVGSGKTTVLVHRILAIHLLDGVPLERIAVLTFTRKAAGEIRERLARSGGVAPESLRLVGTFHGVARRLLEDDLPLESVGRRPGFEILHDEARDRWLQKLIDEHGLRIAYRKRLPRRVEAFRQGRARYGAMKRDDDIEELVRLYAEARVTGNALDFDDLVDLTIELAPALPSERRPAHVTVDEFQDSDGRLVDFLAALGGGRAATFVVGDPNQTIYSWRGTQACEFERYVREFGAKELTLPVNYRSSASIVGAASRLLPGFGAIVPTRAQGESVRVLRHHDATCEAEYVAGRLGELVEGGLELDRAAVLVRLRDQLAPLRAMLAARGLPFRDGVADSEARGVALMTLHASKGLEFDWVYLAGANDGLLPLGKGDRSHRDEEQRLFFVGLTRARDRAEIGWLVRPDLPRTESAPSPFIAALGSAAVEHVEASGPQPARSSEPAIAGRRVSHPVYGEGELLSLDGDRMVCRFPKRGEKAFSRSFSRVEILD